MATTYSFRDRDGDLGDYIDTTSKRLGISKADVLRQAVRLAQQAGLFEGKTAADYGNATQNGSSALPDVDADNVGRAGVGRDAVEDGGVHAADLPQVEAGPKRAGNDDSSQQGDPSGGQESNSFWTGW